LNIQSETLEVFQNAFSQSLNAVFDIVIDHMVDAIKALRKEQAAIRLPSCSIDSNTQSVVIYAMGNGRACILQKRFSNLRNQTQDISAGFLQSAGSSSFINRVDMKAAWNFDWLRGKSRVFVESWARRDVWFMLEGEECEGFDPPFLIDKKQSFEALAFPMPRRVP
jgi:hypothetical protein